MEKLQPILKQKFWILLGVGLILTITGWWMATGTLAANTKTRRDLVEGAFGKVPTGDIPNNDWSTKLAARNTEQERAVNNTKYVLWERQRQQMTWPANIPLVPYRTEIPLGGRELYRTEYAHDVLRVWKTVNPFIFVDGSGIVVYGQNEKILPQRTWGRLAPSSAEMWDAQEDLWLLESLLTAILDVNGGKEALRGDASIHVIEKLELYGGQAPGQRKVGGGGGGGGGVAAPAGAGGAHGAGGPMGGPTGLAGADGMGGRAGGAPLASADFDRRDEFGEDGSSASRAGAGPGGFGGAASSGPGGGHAAAPVGAGGGPGAGGAAGASAASNVRRYIEDDAALPYKTRGFYMTVIMDHRKIPSLIAELSASENSAWPVEIVRVQMVRLHDDDVGSGSTGGLGGPAGGYGPSAGPGGGGGGFNLSQILSGGGGATAGPSGYPASGTGFESGNEGFTPSIAGANAGALNGGANATATSPAAAGLAALQGSLQDPFMARVAIAGIITLYKEVKPEPVVAQPAAPAAPAAPVAPAAGQPATTTPAAAPSEAPAATPAEAAPAESNPSKDAAEPGTTPPATPAEPAKEGAAAAEVPKAAAAPENR